MSNMFKRCTSQKILSGKEVCFCWYCGLPTQYAMTEKDGSEIWCCEHHLVKIGKIKRFKKRMGKYASMPKKVNNSVNSTCKNQETATKKEGCEDGID
jgi:hypothetical protein